MTGGALAVAPLSLSLSTASVSSKPCCCFRLPCRMRYIVPPAHADAAPQDVLSLCARCTPREERKQRTMQGSNHRGIRMDRIVLVQAILCWWVVFCAAGGESLVSLFTAVVRATLWQRGFVFAVMRPSFLRFRMSCDADAYEYTLRRVHCSRV